MPPPKLYPDDYISPTCDLDLISRNPFFNKDFLQDILAHVMHHRLCSSEDIFWTKPGHMNRLMDTAIPVLLQNYLTLPPKKYIRKHSTKTNTMAERGHKT